MKIINVLILLSCLLLTACSSTLIEENNQITAISRSNIANKKYKVTITSTYKDNATYTDTIFYYTNDNTLKVGDTIKITRFE